MAVKRQASEDKGNRPNVEATLERIVSNVAADNQFALYKLVNYRRGGSMLEAYANGGGGNEVDRICKDILPAYMYNEGEGQQVTTAVCLNWRNRHIGEVSIPISAPSNKRANLPNNNKEQSENSSLGGSMNYSFGTIPPYNAPEDHVACWILDKRGALGENPLHVLVICDTPTHTCVAKILLNRFPKLASDIMECSEYYGLSPLHLAVAYNNMELVKAFVMAGANVNERAVGRFFMPTDQQQRMQKGTNYEGLSYLGEYPLSWAACCENEAIYNYLLDNGADPNLQDNFGNMVLHMVVISNKLSMYGYALRHPKKPANNEMLNQAGLTPLALACTLGRNKIFREMLELSAVEFWRFCNVTCSAYPLIALDTISPDGGTNWKSALMIILNGETDEHLDMLEGGVVQRLLEDKWKTFARTQFLKRLAILILHLMFISIAVYLRPEFSEEIEWHLDAETIIRYCAELGALLGSGNFVFLQQGSEIRAQGITAFLANLTRSPAKFVFLLSNICMLICIPCRLLGLRLVEDSLLIFALPGSWFFLMFFAGAVRLTGPFVTMIYSMIAGDMVRFGIIYLIILLGFSQAFFFLFKTCYVGAQDQDDTNVDMYSTYYGTWMALYHMTLGSYQYGDFSKPKYASLTLGIFIIFMVMVPILLLNMLIAMMGNTYANVINKSEKEFVKQWAKIVLALERSVTKDNAKEYLNTYAINLGPPPEPGGLQLKGVMAINCKPKTKAQQRKGAFINWRRSGKRVIHEMRKYNCKGDQLLSKLAQVAASTKVSRRGSFPRLLGEALEVGFETKEKAPPRVQGGFHEALEQLAFIYDMNLEPPGATSTSSVQHLTGTLSTTSSSNGSATPVPYDDIKLPEAQTVHQTLRVVSPPTLYQNIKKLQSNSLSIDGDVASVALMAVQATFDQTFGNSKLQSRTTANVAMDDSQPEISEAVQTAQARGTNTGEPKKDSLSLKQGQQSQQTSTTTEIHSESRASPQKEVPKPVRPTESIQIHGECQASIVTIPKDFSDECQLQTDHEPTASMSKIPKQPSLSNSESVKPKEVPVVTGSQEHSVPYVVAVRPKSTPHGAYRAELVLLPSNLKDIRVTSAAVMAASSSTGHRLVRRKTHRRRKGFRKFANRVGAMAPIQVLTTLDLNPSTAEDSSTVDIRQPLLDDDDDKTKDNCQQPAIAEAKASLPTSPEPTAPITTAVPQASQTSNEQTRWTTPSFLSMASIVAWDEGNDSD